MITQIYNLSFLQLVFLGVTTLGLLMLFLYGFVIILPGLLRRNRNKNTLTPPLSVVICAKNEAENLAAFLPKVLQQNYPDYEVIVVNDCSEDDTSYILSELQLKYKHLRYTTIEPDKKFHHGKKLAVSLGLKAAKHACVVLTDADCEPASADWLKSVAESYGENTEFVLGYGAYKPRKGFLDKLVRFETTWTAMLYFSWARIGMPYMGVGRNLSYLKDVFFKNKGFQGHYHLLSGDDDLFVNAHANKKNTTLCINPLGFTNSVPPTSFADWFKQKKRHLSTSGLYKKKHKFALFIEPFARLLFYTGLIGFITVYLMDRKIELEEFFIILSIILGTKWLIQLLVVKVGMMKLKEKGFWFYALLFDIILPPVQLAALILNKITVKKTKWR